MPKQTQTNSIAFLPIHSSQKDLFNWKELSQQTSKWIENVSKEIILKEDLTEDLVKTILTESLSKFFSSGHVEKKKRAKQAKSAYIFFCTDKRSEIKQENPDLTGTEITKLLGEKWAGLSEADKKPYVEMWEKEKEQLKLEKESEAESASGSSEESEGESDKKKKKKEIKSKVKESDKKEEKKVEKKKLDKKVEKKVEEKEISESEDDSKSHIEIKEKVSEDVLKKKTIKELVEYIQEKTGKVDTGLVKLKKSDLLSLAVKY